MEDFLEEFETEHFLDTKILLRLNCTYEIIFIHKTNLAGGVYGWHILAEITSSCVRDLLDSNFVRCYIKVFGVHVCIKKNFS